MSLRVNGKVQLWLRALDSLQAQPLRDTDGATFPFWSPDSRYIGFFAQGKLKKIAASGGPAESVCETPSARGGSWSRDNVILFYNRTSVGGALQRVSAAGGTPVDVIQRSGASVWPAFLPDGRRFLYVESGAGQQNGIYVASLDGKENRRILADQSAPVLAARHLLFVREGTLMAQPFDTSNGMLTGDAVPVAEGIELMLSHAPITISSTGMLIYQAGSTLGYQLAWYDRNGNALGSPGTRGQIIAPALSPDARSTAFGRLSSSGADIWLMDLARNAERLLTSNANINGSPFWSPAGDRIVFNSNRAGGAFNLYQRRIDASGDELLLKNGNRKAPTQWSHDGRFIVYSEEDPKTKWDIWVLPMEGAPVRKPVPFLRTQFNEFSGQISPDGHWMAYTSDESGQSEVYVRSFPNADGPTRISISGGEQPRWRADGKELFYWGGGKLMAVPVQTGTASGEGAKTTFQPGVPQQLFETELSAPVAAMDQYDVTADGKRFLVNAVSFGSATSAALNVVVNWDAGLKK
jgi:Tol biopolymer transport system component